MISFLSLWPSPFFVQRRIEIGRIARQKKKKEYETPTLKQKDGK
jgi:hypothetical protein